MDREVDTDLSRREKCYSSCLLHVMWCALHYMPLVCSVTYSKLWLMKTCGHVTYSRLQRAKG